MLVMDSRAFSRGIGVGQFMQRRVMKKEDVLDFFRRLYEAEDCSESCPFVEECNKVITMSNEESTLCDILDI